MDYDTWKMYDWTIEDYARALEMEDMFGEDWREMLKSRKEESEIDDYIFN